MTGASPVGRFRPTQRIRKRIEFEIAQSRGRRVTTEHFVLLLSSRDTKNQARLGLVASRKVGGAVVRNRAKRLVREAFRSIPNLFLPGIDLVVIVRKPLSNMTPTDVIAEWRSAERVIVKRMKEAGLDLERLQAETEAKAR